ncbi:hypothetical protein [Streptomyces syringium]|uniref:hypothetical protein n=1 Tax=Streptomyces syringium TaxID=76729 RepID=UPI0037D68EF9
MNLPEPPPGWPTIQPYTATVQPVVGAVELHAERPAVVYVPGPGGQMVPVLREHLPAQAPLAPPARNLAPRPVIDPIAQRLVGAGALGAGAGWGAAQVVSAVAGAGTGLLVLALLILAARLGGGRSVTNISHNTVYSTTSWWGRSNISQ